MVCCCTWRLHRLWKLWCLLLWTRNCFDWHNWPISGWSFIQCFYNYFTLFIFLIESDFFENVLCHNVQMSLAVASGIKVVNWDNESYLHNILWDHNETGSVGRWDLGAPVCSSVPSLMFLYLAHRTAACSYVLLSLIYISLTVNKGPVPFRHTWIPYVVSLRREELFMDMQIRLSSVVTGCRPNVLLIQMKMFFLSGRSHTNNSVVCLTQILMIILDFAVLLLFLLLKIKFTTPQNNILFFFFYTKCLSL